MENKLELTKVDKAYTINSADNEYSSSNKGVYKDYNIASTKAKGSGWYGSNGTVEDVTDLYQDVNGVLYKIKLIGKFTDEEEKYRTDTINSIKSKLTKEELELLNI